MPCREDALLRELEAAGLNANAGIARFSKDKKLYLGLVRKFVLNHSEDMKSLETFISLQNYDEVYRLVHSLRSVTGHIAADDISEQLRVLVQELKDQKTLEALKDLFTDLIHDYLKLLGRISTIDIPESFEDSSVQSAGSAAGDGELGHDELLDSLISLSEYIDQQQPGESFKTLNKLLSAIPDSELRSRLQIIRKMIDDYNFSDSSDLVNKLINELSTD